MGESAMVADKKIAKKNKNIEQYKIRCEYLKSRQDLANKLRKKGYVGSDKEIVERYENELKQNYVKESLDGPSGYALQKWLKNRVATVERVRRFFDERPELTRVLENKAA
jgi:UDP-N-acetyl-D-mannosaminuronic acid transferase (WecB/TagA/CpsF family)